MNLITLGSKFLDDAIIYKTEELHNRYRMVGISPFTLCDSEIGYVDEESYESKMFNIECNSNLGKDIAELDYDFFVVDFLMVSSTLYRCTKDKTKRLFTKSLYVEKNKNKISERLQIEFDEEVNPMKFCDNEIRVRIKSFYEYISSFVPKEKLVLVKWQIPYQYIVGEEIENDEFDSTHCINILITKCQQYFQEFSKCKTIAMPKSMVRLSSSKGGRELCLPEYCKNYLANMLLTLPFDTNIEEDVLQEYELAHNQFIKNYKKKDIFVLNEFEGEYQDCFGNVVESKSKCTIEICGHNSIIIVEKGNADRLTVVAKDNCHIKIGEGTTFANNCVLIAQGHKIIFGRDDMLSTEVICDATKDDIIIGEHVWLGYQVRIESGTHIGDGSIVGARTVVYGTVPNNCIVVGKECKVVRKDIYWEREPFTDFIEKEEYAHFTEI